MVKNIMEYLTEQDHEVGEAIQLEFGRQCRAGKQSSKSNMTNIVPYQTTVVGRGSTEG